MRSTKTLTTRLRPRNWSRNMWRSKEVISTRQVYTKSTTSATLNSVKLFQFCAHTSQVLAGSLCSPTALLVKDASLNFGCPFAALTFRVDLNCCTSW